MLVLHKYCALYLASGYPNLLDINLNFRLVQITG
jgi:hypothetical protein